MLSESYLFWRFLTFMKNSIFGVLLAIFAIGLFACLKQVNAASLDYTVQAGDSLSIISQKQLGDVNKWVDIYDANKDQISDPNSIYPGEVLKMPEESTIQTMPVYSDDVVPNVVTQNITESQVPVYTLPVYSAPVFTSAPRGASNYQDVITTAAAKYGVDATLMNKIISCESGYNPNAYNPSGATGIAQFMPGTYYGSWNIYKNQYPLSSPVGQIYAMALKISEGGVGAWSCYYMVR